MAIRIPITVIVVLALVNVLLALGLWSTIARGSVPPLVGKPVPPATPAVQRLVELFGSSAFRSVITNDYAALNELIKQSATWPEVVYVSVENAQGRILADTDSSRVGRIWSDRVTDEIRSTVKVPYEDVAVAIPDPADTTRSTRIGRVHFGYLANAAPAAPPPSRPPFPLSIVLGLAALAAVPTGLVVVKLATTSQKVAVPPAGNPGSRGKPSKRSARIPERRAEAQRLRNEHTLEDRQALAPHLAQTNDTRRVRTWSLERRPGRIARV
jgi:hypothetical protein